MEARQRGTLDATECRGGRRCGELVSGMDFGRAVVGGWSAAVTGGASPGEGAGREPGRHRRGRSLSHEQRHAARRSSGRDTDRGSADGGDTGGVRPDRRTSYHEYYR